MLPADLLPLLPDLATFARVVEAGNFSSAARQLGTAPSTISRQMQRLERALGARLLERSTRRIRLTESGEQVYRHCREMVEAASGAVDAASRMSAQPRGRVSISAPISLAKSMIHPLIPGFLSAYEEVEVQVVFDDRDIDPIRDHVDLVVRPTSTPPSGLAARRLGTVRWMPCASRAYLQARGTPREPGDLAQHDCLCLGDAPDEHRWTFRQGAQTQTVEVRGRYVANDVGARREAALLDLGIASLPDFAVADDLRSGALVQALPDWSFEPRAYSGPIWLLYPPNRFLLPKVRVLIDWLAERLPPIEQRAATA
ncbi:LysR family transcriptional regulator [Paraburkholderia sp. MMS20-SJTN17]|uniref:LysR family transcriptional regulator n=1 Tax=Paraburkholderia translucens TaxID=2886945 RepID=A0ABS8KED0_9BURK|nr:LysR family transcriptional regulator [Paraburkholderia sp. MMS20-SJTN17]MCC8402762.1 LysR family transcriptional regulator [Paraburkholderia sp. MMS20-SJTN17]